MNLSGSVPIETGPWLRYRDAFDGGWFDRACLVRRAGIRIGIMKRTDTGKFHVYSLGGTKVAEGGTQDECLARLADQFVYEQ